MSVLQWPRPRKTSRSCSVLYMPGVAFLRVISLVSVPRGFPFRAPICHTHDTPALRVGRFRYQLAVTRHISILSACPDRPQQHAALYHRSQGVPEYVLTPVVQAEGCRAWARHLFIHSFIRSSVHSLIRSFAHPFILTCPAAFSALICIPFVCLEHSEYVSSARSGRSKSQIPWEKTS